MLRNPQHIPEEQEEGEVWQKLMKEAVQQVAQVEAENREWLKCDETHHIPNRHAPKSEEQQKQPANSTMDNVMKKQPEKRRCGWPGMRFTPLQKPKKGNGRVRK